MAVFKMYECDFGFTYNGTNYQFTHVESVTIEDPEKTRLVRGSNAGNKLGLAYKEGLKEAKTITVVILGVEKDIHDLLKQAYQKTDRLDVNITSRVDGSSKIGKNAVLAQSPKQLSMDDSPDSMNMSLVFETFDVDEVHKS